MKSLNEIAQEAHENAKAKGFYDDPPTALERHMLIVTEIAEASEEMRNGTPEVYFRAFDETIIDPGHTGFHMHVADNSKPEGELIELADAIIRICDYAGSRDWDLDAAVALKMRYNSTRPHMHGGKLK